MKNTITIVDPAQGEGTCRLGVKKIALFLP